MALASVKGPRSDGRRGSNKHILWVLCPRSLAAVIGHMM